MVYNLSGEHLSKPIVHTLIPYAASVDAHSEEDKKGHNYIMYFSVPILEGNTIKSWDTMLKKEDKADRNIAHTRTRDANQEYLKLIEAKGLVHQKAESCETTVKSA